jgi:hypothetical protein
MGAEATLGGNLGVTSVGSTEVVAGRLRRRIVALVQHEARRLLLPIAVLTVVSSLGTAAAPALGHRPLLLVALSPRLAFLALAAPKVSLVPFFVVGMVRLTLSDPFHFILGRRHGSKMVDRFTHRWVVRAKSVVTRCIPVAVFLRPNGTNLALAGAARSRVSLIVLADLVGTAAYLVLVHQCGHAMLA